MSSEIWKVITEFPNYEVSNFGRVKSLGRYIPVKAGAMRFKKETILKPKDNGKGYKAVNLSTGDGNFKVRYIHRLVAFAFLALTEGLDEVNHIDGDKANNEVSNLEWCDRSHNVSHAFSTGLRTAKKGREQHRYKGDIHAFDSDGKLVMVLVGQKQMKDIGLIPSHVYNCVNGVYKTHKGFTFKRIPKEG